MQCEKRLSELRVSERATVKKLLFTESARRRFLDIGLVPGTVVECVGESPLSGMRAYRVRGAKIAIRCSDAAGVIIK